MAHIDPDKVKAVRKRVLALLRFNGDCIERGYRQSHMFYRFKVGNGADDVNDNRLYWLPKDPKKRVTRLYDVCQFSIREYIGTTRIGARVTTLSECCPPSIDYNPDDGRVAALALHPEHPFLKRDFPAAGKKSGFDELGKIIRDLDAFLDFEASDGPNKMVQIFAKFCGQHDPTARGNPLQKLTDSSNYSSTMRATLLNALFSPGKEYVLDESELNELHKTKLLQSETNNPNELWGIVINCFRGVCIQPGVTVLTPPDPPLAFTVDVNLADLFAAGQDLGSFLKTFQEARKALNRLRDALCSNLPVLPIAQWILADGLSSGDANFNKKIKETWEQGFRPDRPGVDLGERILKETQQLLPETITDDRIRTVLSSELEDGKDIFNFHPFLETSKVITHAVDIFRQLYNEALRNNFGELGREDETLAAKIRKVFDEKIQGQPRCFIRRGYAIDNVEIINSTAKLSASAIPLEDGRVEIHFVGDFSQESFDQFLQQQNSVETKDALRKAWAGGELLLSAEGTTEFRKYAEPAIHARSRVIEEANAANVSLTGPAAAGYEAQLTAVFGHSRKLENLLNRERAPNLATALSRLAIRIGEGTELKSEDVRNLISIQDVALDVRVQLRKVWARQDWSAAKQLIANQRSSNVERNEFWHTLESVRLESEALSAVLDNKSAAEYQNDQHALESPHIAKTLQSARQSLLSAQSQVKAAKELLEAAEAARAEAKKSLNAGEGAGKSLTEAENAIAQHKTAIEKQITILAAAENTAKNELTRGITFVDQQLALSAQGWNQDSLATARKAWADILTHRNTETATPSFKARCRHILLARLVGHLHERLPLSQCKNDLANLAGLLLGLTEAVERPDNGAEEARESFFNRFKQRAGDFFYAQNTNELSDTVKAIQESIKRSRSNLVNLVDDLEGLTWLVETLPEDSELILFNGSAQEFSEQDFGAAPPYFDAQWLCGNTASNIPSLVFATRSACFDNSSRADNWQDLASSVSKLSKTIATNFDQVRATKPSWHLPMIVLAGPYVRREELERRNTITLGADVSRICQAEVQWNNSFTTGLLRTSLMHTIGSNAALVDPPEELQTNLRKGKIVAELPWAPWVVIGAYLGCALREFEGCQCFQELNPGKFQSWSFVGGIANVGFCGKVKEFADKLNESCKRHQFALVVQAYFGGDDFRDLKAWPEFHKRLYPSAGDPPDPKGIHLRSAVFEALQQNPLKIHDAGKPVESINDLLNRLLA